MPGSKALRKIQLGKEGTAGTEVNATTIWRGTGVFTDEQETVFPSEDIGVLSTGTRVYIPKVTGILTMEETPATFEQLPYIFEGGVEAETPTQDGTGTGYIYTYNFATTSQNTINTYTLEGGDDQQEEQGLYGHVESFGLTGNAGEAVMMSAVWRVRQVETGTFTGALTAPTVEEILFQKGKIYIDGTGTYPATTQKSNTLLAFDMQVTTGFIPKWTADGQLYFSFTQQVMPEISLSITFEHDGTATAEKSAWRAGTARSVRLIFEGSAISDTTGATYTVQTFIIDLLGHWQTFGALEDQDGNDIVTGTLLGHYDTTNTALGKFIVVNELSALP